LDWAEGDMATSDPDSLKCIEDEVPRDDEFHVEYIKSLAVMVTKEARHCKKKKAADFRLFG
jgi:hypothetical protein